MERQLIVCDNDTRPTNKNPKAVQRRKLIMPVAGKELMSFFSYFQALQ